MERTLRDRKAVLVFVLPALLLYTLVLIAPIVWSIAYSFFEGSPIGGFEFVGLSNYGKLWQDKDFLNSLWFSAKYAIVVTSGQVFLGLLLALLYTFYLKRSSPFVRTLVFFPVILPTVAVAQMFVKLFEIAPQYGLVNAILVGIGLKSWVQPRLGQGDTAFWVAAIMNIWTAMGFYAVLLYAGLLDIPNEIIESAQLDGASIYTVFSRVALPMLTNAIVAVGLVQFFFIWNDLLLSLTFISETELRTVQTGLLNFVGRFGQREWGPTFASISMTVIPMFLIYLVLNNSVMKGLTAGAVKG